MLQFQPWNRILRRISSLLAIPDTYSDPVKSGMVTPLTGIIKGLDPEGKKTLEKPPENPPENQLEISYTGKSPKLGSLDMS